MRRPIFGSICLSFVMISCTLPEPIGGQCANDLMLGDEGCQCVTSDTTYSEHSAGYIDPEQIYLGHCNDQDNPAYVELGPSDIYACRNYMCVTHTCGEDEIPDADRIACIKKAVCGENAIYQRDTNTCACDEPTYVEVGGRCVESVEGTCDTTKEVYRKSSNMCVCDAELHWTGEDGSCRCMTGYVEIDGQCVESVESRCDPLKEAFDTAVNRCVCNAEAHWTGDAGACVCQSGYFRVNGGACVSANSLVVGDEVEFGRYLQDVESEEPAPLVWQVLESRSDAVLLLSKYVLECYDYHDPGEAIAIANHITWEKSNVRSYLNGLGAAHNQNKINHEGNGFIDRAFTAEEQKWIKKVTNRTPDSPPSTLCILPGGNNTEDRIFLLSADDIFKYFPTNRARIASPTAYAIIHPADGVGHDMLNVCEMTCTGNDCRCASCNNRCEDTCTEVLCASSWWLRSPGKCWHANGSRQAFVDGSGTIGDINVTSQNGIGLRPALYVLKSI